MGFTKLDEGILQSSIIGESSDVFKVWIALLAACKEDGIARVSPVFLSSICKLDIGIVMRSLEKLMSPDPYSRSKEEEGRRLKEVNGGYLLVNYYKYRDRTYSGSKEAIRKRKQRSPKKDDDTPSDPRHQEFVDRFAKFYLERMATSYVFQPKDFANLKTFLVNNSDVTVERMGVACANCFMDEFNRNFLTVSYVLSNFSRLENLIPKEPK